MIAVDALGQPDPQHAMLDIAASFRGTHLEGSSLMMLDAAVLADKLVIATQSWLLMYVLICWCSVAFPVSCLRGQSLVPPLRDGACFKSRSTPVRAVNLRMNQCNDGVAWEPQSALQILAGLFT